MYSLKVQALLKKKHLAIGDRLSIHTAGKEVTGLLLPQTVLGDPDTLVLKTDSGYNLGIRLSPSATLRKAASTTPSSRPVPPKLSFSSSRPPISMISIGGTITSRVDYKTGGATTLSRPADILRNIPELAQVANIKSILTPFSLMSENMTSDHWQRLARVCAKELNKKGVEWVIVTQGTDTLHFTAAALSFFLRNPGKPVVLTASQRSTDRGSSDAGLNLICSAHAALSPVAEVGVCMHGSLNDDHCLFIRGTKVRKMDTQRRDAFRPVNDLPLAIISASGEFSITNPLHRRRKTGSKTTLDIRFEPQVSLLQAYPGSDPTVMDYLIKKGVKGFVVQATGLGQLPLQKNSWLPSIKNAVSSGVPVFLAAQTLYGRLNTSVYSEGRTIVAAGAVPLEDMLPETAYVKLGWVLGHTKSPKKVKEMMLTSYAGEISPRTLPETFLY